MLKEINYLQSIKNTEREGTEETADTIRAELAPHILSGAATFIEDRNLEGEFSLESERERLAWIYAVSGNRYNAIYFMSRSSARDALPFISQNRDEIERVDEAIQSHGGVVSIVNFAIHKFVADFPNQAREVRFSKKSIPPFAIQTYDKNTLYVKEKDFAHKDPLNSFHNPASLGDWHDFSHFLAAAVSNGAFGVRYHHGLDRLDRYYRALTEGSGMQDASGPLFSDGIVFTELSKPLFEYFEQQAHLDENRVGTDQEIEDAIAEKLVGYFKGEQALFHPRTNQYLQAPRSMDPAEVAVCIQNKRCERQAAEFEKHLFVRGSPEGARGNPLADPLYHLSLPDRIIAIVNLIDPVYFERRNIIRHRAHENALAIYAQDLLLKKRKEYEENKDIDKDALKKEVFLLEDVLSFYRLDDIQAGREINLYNRVEEVVKAA